jgi:hypothetical protein
MAEAVARFVAAGSNSSVPSPALFVAQASVVLLGALASAVLTEVRDSANASSVLILTTVVSIVPPLLALGTNLTTVEAFAPVPDRAVLVAKEAVPREPGSARFGDPTNAASDAILPAELRVPHKTLRLAEKQAVLCEIWSARFVCAAVVPFVEELGNKVRAGAQLNVHELGVLHLRRKTACSFEDRPGVFVVQELAGVRGAV